jgi:hypothetical protein
VTLIFIGLGVLLFWLAIVAQSMALARAAARGDAMIVAAAARERKRPVARHRDAGQVAA